jgi:hypothetical protein
MSATEGREDKTDAEVLLPEFIGIGGWLPKRDNPSF